MYGFLISQTSEFKFLLEITPCKAVRQLRHTLLLDMGELETESLLMSEKK